MASFGTFLTYLFFFTTGRRKDEAEKMKQILNSLNISDFISKCTNYNIIHLFITELSMVVSL